VFQLDVAAATLEGAGDRWALELPVGPRQMLSTGQWDATGQLLSHGAELDALVQRLPYLNGFQGLHAFPVGGEALRD
jgi:3-isopropylmalate/(R)-2-methylmalate dehydratase small subunit